MGDRIVHRLKGFLIVSSQRYLRSASSESEYPTMQASLVRAEAISELGGT